MNKEANTHREAPPAQFASDARAGRGAGRVRTAGVPAQRVAAAVAAPAVRAGHGPRAAVRARGVRRERGRRDETLLAGLAFMSVNKSFITV